MCEDSYHGAKLYFEGGGEVRYENFPHKGSTFPSWKFAKLKTFEVEELKNHFLKKKNALTIDKVYIENYRFKL